MKMKSLLLIALMITGTTTMAQQSQSDKAVVTKAKISWDTKEFDFGNIPFDIPAKASFTLSNNTKEPVNIAKVRTSCGCTVPKYAKTPILPGKESTITVVFNAKKEGKFRKMVTIEMAGGEKYFLTIKGFVKKS